MEERTRRKRKRKRGAWPVLLVLAAVALIVIALSPVCSVGEVTITGNEKVLSQQIMETVGELKGRNIFRISLGKLEEKIENIPYIKEASVSRLLPDKLRIEITESSIAMYVPFSGKMVCVDADGEVLEIIDPDQAIGAPVANGFSIKECEVGEHIAFKNETDEESFLLAVQYVNYLKEYELFSKVTELDVSSSSNVQFTLNYKLRVEFGTDEQISYKMKYLKQVIAEVGEHTEGRINIRTVDRVTFREGPDATEAPAVTEAPEGAETEDENVTEVPTEEVTSEE